MDELREFCARMLADPDEAARVAKEAGQAPGLNRLTRLAQAVRACRAHDGPAPLADEAPTITNSDLATAVACEVAVASADLPQRQREALALRELLGLSHAEIGQVMAIEPTAVAPLLARARLRLRAELRHAPMAAGDCPERDRTLRTVTLRQDGEQVPPADDSWLIEHLGHCRDCARAHAAMLEGSVCYRGWRQSVPLSRPAGGAGSRPGSANGSESEAGSEPAAGAGSADAADAP
jgi:Sigma-70, region 4